MTNFDLKIKNARDEHFKPLDGVTFYIESRRSDSKAVAANILSLGGTIERFFSRNITYLITDKIYAFPDVPLRKSSRCLQESELSRPQHPAELTKCNERTSLSKVQYRAKQFGIKMQTVSRLKTWLQQIEYKGPRIKEKTACKKEIIRLKSNKKCTQQIECKEPPIKEKTVCKKEITRLKSPFIKVEDKSKKFHPLWEEMIIFPQIYFESGIHQNPFSECKQPNSNTNESSCSSSLSHSSSGLSYLLSEQVKNGYCELCDSYFKNRKLHLQSRKHFSTAKSCDFGKLDKLISQGCDFQTYLDILNTNKILKSATLVDSTVPIRIDHLQEEKELYTLQKWPFIPHSPTKETEKCLEKRIKVNDFSFASFDRNRIDLRRKSHSAKNPLVPTDTNIERTASEWKEWKNRKRMIRMENERKNGMHVWKEWKTPFFKNKNRKYCRLRRSKRTISKENGYHQLNLRFLI